MSVIIVGDDEFRREVSMMDATSISRPDPTWAYTDPAGHVHRWCVNGVPVESYDPMRQYMVPTIHRESDGEYWCDECRDMHEESHLECNQCGAHVTPGTCADTQPVFVLGLVTYYVNQERVSPEEFERRAMAAMRRSRPTSGAQNPD